MDRHNGAAETERHSRAGQVDNAVAQLGLELVVGQRDIAHAAVHGTEDAVHGDALHAHYGLLLRGLALRGLYVRSALYRRHRIPDW